MSTKSTIFLTGDNIHWYYERSSHGLDEKGNDASAIGMEFNKKDIEILVNDSEDLIIEIKPGSELYAILRDKFT